jgi:hypothetical protein
MRLMRPMRSFMVDPFFQARCRLHGNVDLGGWRGKRTSGWDYSWVWEGLAPVGNGRCVFHHDSFERVSLWAGKGVCSPNSPSTFTQKPALSARNNIVSTQPSTLPIVLAYWCARLGHHTTAPSHQLVYQCHTCTRYAFLQSLWTTGGNDGRERVCATVCDRDKRTCK